MASLKVALDMRKKAKDGKGSILIRICHRGTVAEVPTKIRMDKDHFKDGKIVNTPNASVLNLSIQEKVLAIDKTIAVLMMDEEKFLNMSANEIKQIFLGQKPIIKKKEDVTVVAMFKDYMENSTLKEGTKDIMRIACNKVVTFAGNNVKMNQLDLKWLRSFDKFLSETQCANGRAIYLRSLRAVCNYAKHLGVTTNYPFDNFQIKQEPTRKRSIPIDLFRKFYHYPTTKVNQQYRDYFFLMFFLIGINTKDLLLAKKSQIVDGRLEYVRAKTNKRYSILIEPEAQELLDKYKGNGEYIVNAMDHCKHYKSFAREINDALCNIGEVVVYMVSVHQSRSILLEFAVKEFVNCYQISMDFSGIHKISIMLITMPHEVQLDSIIKFLMDVIYCSGSFLL